MPSDADATPTLKFVTVDDTRIDRHAHGPPWSNLPARLEVAFGLGDKPDVRRALYHKLLRLCDQHGTPCYRHVRDVGRTALRKGGRGNWFCAAIVRRLSDCGYDI